MVSVIQKYLTYSTFLFNWFQAQSQISLIDSSNILQIFWLTARCSVTALCRWKYGRNISCLWKPNPVFFSGKSILYSTMYAFNKISVGSNLKILNLKLPEPSKNWTSKLLNLGLPFKKNLEPPQKLNLKPG